MTRFTRKAVVEVYGILVKRGWGEDDAGDRITPGDPGEPVHVEAPAKRPRPADDPARGRQAS